MAVCLVKLVVIIITINTSPCAAVSRAVSVTCAMIVNDDQSTMYVISQRNACVVSSSNRRLYQWTILTTWHSKWKRIRFWFREPGKTGCCDTVSMRQCGPYMTDRLYIRLSCWHGLRWIKFCIKVTSLRLCLDISLNRSRIFKVSK